MVVSGTKIDQKMQFKSLLTIEKNIINSEKMLYYNYKKLFLFFKNSNGFENSFDEDQIKAKYQDVLKL